MKCPKCRREHTEGANFCMECGHNFQRPEKTLSIDFNKPHSYTPKFLADKILTTRSAIEGERKRVTVLFADVANYTSISEKLDPEQVHQIMDGCFKILMDEIHQFEGTINQFTGDGVMALFGAPIALENHAQNACRAGLAIQNAIKKYSQELNKKYGFEFKMRIGLNSGPVIVGSIGDDLRMDYTAIGDTTNLAARMESLAEPGTVLVSPNTHQRVDKQFEFESLGKVEVKGKESVIDVYVLTKEKLDRPRLGLERQIFSEMIGRDTELNKLELQINKAINGEGSVVNVIGEAGVGKSRLIAELRNSMVLKRVTLLEGRAISIGRNLSFHPITDLFRHWAHINEDDTSEIALNKLEIAIKRVTPKDKDEILPFLATLMGMKLPTSYAQRLKDIEEEALEKLIFKNIRDFIIKSTESSPLVIVMEDLHWADSSSIELLESLFRLATTQRIVFINVFRPNYPETSERIIETIKKNTVYYVEISLQPLNEQMSEMLINNMLKLKGLQHGLIEKIIDRSGGNPFFIEEVIRSLIDEGAVIRKNGDFIITKKIEEINVPYTINDVLMARIDRLDDMTRDLVKVASVIGRSFFYRILMEVAKTIEDLDDRLAYLKQIELIRERRRMEELEYLFKHALTQEAAYASILHQKQKDLHLDVARSIESVFGERLHEFYGMLALHYIKGEDYENAEKFLIKAGEEAFRTSASSEALNYYKEGLKLYLQANKEAAEPEKLGMFEKNIGIALFNKGKHEESLGYIESVLTRLGANSPKNKISRSLWCLWNILIVLSFLIVPSKRHGKVPNKRQKEIFQLWAMKMTMLIELDPINGFLEQFSYVKSIHRFDMKNVREGLVFKFCCGAQIAYTCISFSLSRKFINLSYKLMNRDDLREQMFFNTTSLAHKWASGEWNELNYDEKLIDYHIGIGELYYPILFLWLYGYIKIETGEFDEVQKTIQKLASVWDNYDYEIARIFYYQLQTDLWIKKRLFFEAEKLADEGALFSSQIGQEQHQVYLLGGKTISQILQKDIEGSLNTIQSNNGIIAKQKFSPPCYLITPFLGQLLTEIELLKQSIVLKDKKKRNLYSRKVHQTFKTAQRKCRKYAMGRTEMFRYIGQYYWVLNDKRKSFYFWNKSVKEGKRIGANVELARTYLEIYRHLNELETGKKKGRYAGVDYLNMAKSIFEELKLQSDIDEMGKIKMGFNSDVASG